MDLKLLEAKLKRHQIIFERNEEELIIGKSKTDYLTLFGLVLLPVVSAIAITAFFLEDILAGQGAIGKIIGGIVLLFSVGGFNYNRIIAKKESNNTSKILKNNEIQFIDDVGTHHLNESNIKGFDYSVQQINPETYEGILYLIDTKDRRFQILGFDDERENYVMDDLKWYANFLQDYVDQ